MHSLKAEGAAAAAAANAGMSNRLLKRHERWKFDRAKDMLKITALRFPKVWFLAKSEQFPLFGSCCTSA